MADQLLQDKNGTYLCPQVVLAEVADLEPPGTPRVCRGELSVVWHSLVAVHDEGPMHPEGFVTRSWALECNEGHVLTRSDSQDESPPAPTLEYLLPVLLVRGSS